MTANIAMVSASLIKIDFFERGHFGKIGDCSNVTYLIFYTFFFTFKPIAKESNVPVQNVDSRSQKVTISVIVELCNYVSLMWPNNSNTSLQVLLGLSEAVSKSIRMCSHTSWDCVCIVLMTSLMFPVCLFCASCVQLSWRAGVQSVSGLSAGVDLAGLTRVACC